MGENNQCQPHWNYAKIKNISYDNDRRECSRTPSQHHSTQSVQSAAQSIGQCPVFDWRRLIYKRYEQINSTDYRVIDIRAADFAADGANCWTVVDCVFDQTAILHYTWEALGFLLLNFNSFAAYLSDIYTFMNYSEPTGTLKVLPQLCLQTFKEYVCSTTP
jgi:hypothetical protein